MNKKVLHDCIINSDFHDLRFRYSWSHRMNAGPLSVLVVSLDALQWRGEAPHSPNTGGALRKPELKISF